MRTPVAAKIALQTAGAITAVACAIPGFEIRPRAHPLRSSRPAAATTPAHWRMALPNVGHHVAMRIIA